MRGLSILKHIASFSNRNVILHSSRSSLPFCPINSFKVWPKVFQFYSTSDSDQGGNKEFSDDEFTGRVENSKFRDRFSQNRNREQSFRHFPDRFQNRSPDRRFQNDFRQRRDDQDSFSDFGGDYDDFGSNLKELDWNRLEPFEKNFYVEHEEVASLPESEVEEFYSNNNITVKKGERMRPILKFSQAYFPDAIQKHLKKWPSPTSIQSMGWPLALSGQNMVGIAQTGSGKTLGFILPALIHIRAQKPVQRGDGPIALVLAPTRELAVQIEEVARQFGRLLGIRTATLYGGASRSNQERQLRESPELIIATPGRLTDFLNTGVVSLRRTTYTVLDEADRMLDMGFEPQVRKILTQVRPDRQMLMWSATWPDEIQNLAHDFLGKDFTNVMVGAGELRANPDIEQVFRLCDPYDKMSLLEDELLNARTEMGRMPKTMIFCQTKRTADNIEHRLYRARIRANAMHGDKSQSRRDSILFQFKTGRTNLLVATDVASRGIDVSDVDLVINYDFPACGADTYIHRIGRTGRAGNKGKAICFLTEDDASHAGDLIQVLKKVGQEVPKELEKLASMRSYKPKKKFGQKGFRNQPYRNNFRNNFRGNDRRGGYNDYRADYRRYDRDDFRRNDRDDFRGIPNDEFSRGGYKQQDRSDRDRKKGRFDYDDDWW